MPRIFANDTSEQVAEKIAVFGILHESWTINEKMIEEVWRLVRAHKQPVHRKKKFVRKENNIWRVK